MEIFSISSELERILPVLSVMIELPTRVKPLPLLPVWFAEIIGVIFSFDLATFIDFQTVSQSMFFANSL